MVGASVVVLFVVVGASVVAVLLVVVGVFVVGVSVVVLFVVVGVCVVVSLVVVSVSVVAVVFVVVGASVVLGAFVVVVVLVGVCAFDVVEEDENITLLWSPSLQIFQPRFLDEGRSRTWMVQGPLHSQSITQDVSSLTEMSQEQISTAHHTGHEVQISTVHHTVRVIIN